MDSQNRFDSKGTYLLARAEALLGLGVVAFLALRHLGEIRWGPFILFFASIDLVGYVPGAIAHRKARGKPISRVYHALYNTMHSFLWNAAVAGAWSLAVRPEWALLAIPIHLLGDRALFGNFFKPFAVPFEPEALPAFTTFEASLARTTT
ncbi:hypothetical protein HY251_01465, partial [bacterium]|nr:hypothetical protein [bacterium]